MQQRSFGRRIWRLFSPIVVKTCVAFIIEVIILTLYLMPHMSEIAATFQNQEEYFQKVVGLELELVSKYGTQMTAVAALATIPILAWMFMRDRRGEERVQKAPLWKYIMVIGISLPFALGLNNILLLSNLAEISEAFQEATEVLYSPSLSVQIVCLGIIIPIMEEFIFRGLIFKRLCEESSCKSCNSVFSIVFWLVSWKYGADYLWIFMWIAFCIFISEIQFDESACSSAYGDEYSCVYSFGNGRI